MLAALALSAVLLGPEAASEPYTTAGQPDQCAAAAISDLGGSTFLAWSVSLGIGKYAVITTVLSPNLSEQPERRTIVELENAPLCVHAAASAANDILVVWTEPTATARDPIVAMRVRRDGSIKDGPRVVGSAPHNRRIDLAWGPFGGGSWLLNTGDGWQELRGPGLTFEQWYALGLAGHYYEGAARAQSSFALVARAEIRTATCFLPNIHPCNPISRTTTVIDSAQPHYMFPAQIRSQTTGGTSPLTLTCIRDRCVSAWLAYEGTGVVSIVTKQLIGSRELALRLDTAPGPVITAAADDERILLVWESGSIVNRRIIGAIADGTDIGTPFTIADGAGFRRQPSVMAMGEGRFLVAYEIGLLDTRLVRLGGRIVDVDPPARRRVAR